VQRLMTSGPRGSPAKPPGQVGPNLQPLASWRRGDTLQEAVEGNPKLKVSGGHTPWPAGQVARPDSYHLVCYRHNHVGNPSMDPYKYSTTGGNQSNTHYL
jgi:hypothetical protein